MGRVFSASRRTAGTGITGSPTWTQAASSIFGKIQGKVLVNGHEQGIISWGDESIETAPASDFNPDVTLEWDQVIPKSPPDANSAR
ncbi:MAG: hypothetical protein HY898_03330 [Deltaproteobacteria bacterium]|nr:hypothetical protein [Deltaproteobacteria bacterium]